MLNRRSSLLGWPASSFCSVAQEKACMMTSTCMAWGAWACVSAAEKAILGQ